MDSKPEIDLDVLELMMLLCTRIGMIMEDVSPVALTTAIDEMPLRIQQIAAASSTISALASAAEALLQD